MIAIMIPKANGRLSIAKEEVVGIKALRGKQLAKVNQYRQAKKLAQAAIMLGLTTNGSITSVNRRRSLEISTLRFMMARANIKKPDNKYLAFCCYL